MYVDVTLLHLVLCHSGLNTRSVHISPHHRCAHVCTLTSVRKLPSVPSQVVAKAAKHPLFSAPKDSTRTRLPTLLC